MNDEKLLGIGDTLEGTEIASIAVEVRGISGGLQDPMKFGPVLFTKGDEYCLVITGKCVDVDFRAEDRKDPESDFVRVQVLTVESGAFIDRSTVAEALKRQAAIVEEGKKREEAEKGINRLDFGGDDDGASSTEPEPDEEEERFALARQHAAGVHSDGIREGCEACELEAAAEQQEADDDASADGAADGPIPIGKATRATKKAAAQAEGE